MARLVLVAHPIPTPNCSMFPLDPRTSANVMHLYTYGSHGAILVLCAFQGSALIEPLTRPHMTQLNESFQLPSPSKLYERWVRPADRYMSSASRGSPGQSACVPFATRGPTILFTHIASGLTPLTQHGWCANGASWIGEVSTVRTNQCRIGRSAVGKTTSKKV